MDSKRMIYFEGKLNLYVKYQNNSNLKSEMIQMPQSSLRLIIESFMLKIMSKVEKKNQNNQ